MTIAERVAAKLAARYWRTASKAEVEQTTTQDSYAMFSLPFAQELVTLVLNEANLSERLQASQAVIDRRGD